MILDEFTGRNCKHTEYIDASGKHWVVRTDPVFVERKLDRYETTLLLHLEHCNVPHRRATSARTRIPQARWICRTATEG
jgi:hypothetical protein